MKTQRVFIAFAFALVLANLVFGQTNSKKEIYRAYESWKQNLLEVKDADGKDNKHQAVTVYAQRIDEKTASVQVLIVSEFSASSKDGFDLTVKAQPQILVKSKDEVLLEKAGYDSNIESHKLFPDKETSVIALPSMTIPVNADSNVISISFKLGDGSEVASQMITIPLKYEGYVTSIGRFASDYNKLRPAEWCGFCDGCSKKCTDCPVGQSGHFNCASCTITCQNNE
jgi:archaellum component FlaF (FlaF/FlaG flagellin family)